MSWARAASNSASGKRSELSGCDTADLAVVGLGLVEHRAALAVLAGRVHAGRGKATAARQAVAADLDAVRRIARGVVAGRLVALGGDVEPIELGARHAAG